MENNSSKTGLCRLRKDSIICVGAVLFVMAAMTAVSYAIPIVVGVSLGRQITIWNLRSQIASLHKQILWLRPITILSSISISYGLLFVILFQIRRLSFHRLFARPTISGRQTALFGVISIGTDYVMSLIISLIILLLRYAHIDLITSDISFPLRSPVGMAAMLFAVVILAPVCEEIVYRGFLLGTLMRYNASFAIVISALIWAICHGNFIQAVPVFFIGILFGIIAVKAHSIIPAMGIHIIINIFAAASGIIRQLKSVPLNLIYFLLCLSLIGLAITFFCAFFETLKIDGQHAELTGKQCAGMFFGAWPVWIFLIFMAVSFVFSVKII